GGVHPHPRKGPAMTTAPLTLFVRQMRQSAAAPRLGGLPDADLLARFLAGADAAFEALVRRHGPTVLAVCRGARAEEPAAEDAFRAPFLVLLRPARAPGQAGWVGGWLCGVAPRVARQARLDAERRRRREQRAARGEQAPPAPDPSWREACAA